MASAAGASVARVLERIATVDPGVRVRDTHPLSVQDPNGLNLFYLMLVTTIVGFLTVFQVLANAGQLPRRDQIGFVVGLAVTASLVLTLVDGPLLNRLALPVPRNLGHSRAPVAGGRLVRLVDGRLARPLGDPPDVAVLRRPRQHVHRRRRLSAAAPPPVRLFLPVASSGATVTALRDAIDFPAPPAPPADRRPRASWAIGLFVAWLWWSHAGVRRARPRSELRARRRSPLAQLTRAAGCDHEPSARAVSTPAATSAATCHGSRTRIGSGTAWKTDSSVPRPSASRRAVATRSLAEPSYTTRGGPHDEQVAVGGSPVSSGAAMELVGPDEAITRMG